MKINLFKYVNRPYIYVLNYILQGMYNLKHGIHIRNNF